MTSTQVGTEVIVEALQLACRAPSLHNSQPWRWVATDGGLELHVDATHTVATDIGGREALLSCGAVLDHLRVALAAAGWRSTVRRFPTPDDPGHLATVELSAAATVTDEQRRRADAILVRRTDRLPLAEPPGWDGLARALGADERADAVRVDTVADDLRGELAQASHLAGLMRLYDAEYHAELSWWTAQFVATDGIPSNALISAAESDRVDVGRQFPVVDHPERRHGLGDDHAKILVLATCDESAYSVLRCGEALSALLLDATMAGLATCTLTHITEVREGRDVVASLIGSAGIPQALVRVGLAPALDAAPPPTPRRPVRDVLAVRRGA